MRALLVAAAVIAGLIFLAAPDPARGEAAGQPHYFRSAQCPLVELRPKASFIIPSAAFIRDLLAERGVPGSPENVWLDLSLHDNEFASGTFLGYGPLTIKPNEAYAHEWPDLLAGATHQYRLNVRLATGGWASIGGGSFETPDCRAVLDVFCLDEAPGITFAIPYTSTLSTRAPAQSWLDVSFFDNGYLPDTFISFGPYDPSFMPYVPRGRAVTAYGMLPSRAHSYRINVLYDDGLWTDNGVWTQQTNRSFTTPDCSNIPLVWPPGLI